MNRISNGVHQRAIMAAALLAAVCVGAAGQSPRQGTAPQASTPEGLALLRKMIAARGGAAKIAAIQDYEEIVFAQTWDNAGKPAGQVRKRTRWMRSPNALRVDQIGPGSTYVLYYDGSSGSGWEILPDVKSSDKFKTVGEAIALAGGELKFAQGYLASLDQDMNPSESMPGYVFTSPSPNVLRISHDGGASDLTLDPVTSLPMSTRGVSLADPDHPVPSEMHMGGWIAFGGVRFATQRTNFHNGVRLAYESTQGAIHINAGLKQADLNEKPANFAPIVPGH